MYYPKDNFYHKSFGIFDYSTKFDFKKRMFPEIHPDLHTPNAIRVMSLERMFAG